MSENEDNKPDYSKSQQLRNLRRLVCVLTDDKPRVPVFLTRKARELEIYDDKARIADNIKQIVRDPRTPVEKKGDRIVNALAQGTEEVKAGGR